MREHGAYAVQVYPAQPSPLVFPQGARLTHLVVQPLAAAGSFNMIAVGGHVYLIAWPAGSAPFDLYPNGDLPIDQIQILGPPALLIAEFVR